MAVDELPAALRGLRRLREADVAAALDSCRDSPAEYMECLTEALAGGEGGTATLIAIQELGDELANEAGRGPMAFPQDEAPTTQESILFIRASAAEQGSGCFAQHAAAHSGSADVVLPLALLLGVDAAFAAFHWWLASALLPAFLIAFSPLMMLWTRRPGARQLRAGPPRYHAVAVAGMMVSGAALFLARLAPALSSTHPLTCALEASMFLLCPYVFWKTVVTDPGFVPLGSSVGGKQNSGESSGGEEGGGKLCSTCACVRPLRSKHDPLLGRCIRKFDHYCPLVWNAVGEDNQGAFVLFCLTMWIGQLCFLSLSLTFLALEGEGPLFVALNTPARGFVHHPVLAFNTGMTAACTLFNTFLVFRAFYGVAAELTSNEQANWPRYAYLQRPPGPDAQPGELSFEYANPFDAGVVANARRFFFSRPGGVDWDFLLSEHCAGRTQKTPGFSVAAAQGALDAFRLRMGWSRAARPRGGGGRGRAGEGQRGAVGNEQHSTTGAGGQQRAQRLGQALSEGLPREGRGGVVVLTMQHREVEREEQTARAEAAADQRGKRKTVCPMEVEVAPKVEE